MSSTLIHATDAHDPLPLPRGGMSERTALAYSKDYDDFARFVGAASGESVLERLVELPAAEANTLVGGYLAYLQQKQKPLKAATIARRINALRSAVKRCHASGRIVWLLNVAAPHVPHRRGQVPAMALTARVVDEHFELLEYPRGRRDSEIKRVRDRCIVRLLGGMKLRRSALVSIDFDDVDLKGGQIMIRRRGRGDKQPVDVPSEVGAVVRQWLELHERKSGPLFYSLHLGRPGKRLTADAVHEIVSRLKSQIDAGLPQHSHSIGA
jgi:site-specific recombinase XerC